MSAAARINQPAKEKKTRFFRWNRRADWHRTMFALLSDKLNDSVLAEIKRLNPQSLIDDGYAWLNESVAKINESPTEDIPSLLATRLEGWYDGIVAFHGCRPCSLDSYRANGLLPSDTAALKLLAKNLFGDTPQLQAAIHDLAGTYEHGNRGSIWLGLTKEPFVGGPHEHFVAGGSEYLRALANRVGGIDILQARGVPTIIECLVLNQQLADSVWPTLGRSMICDWFRRFLGHTKRSQNNTYCVQIREAICPLEMVAFHQYEELCQEFECKHWAAGEKHIETWVILETLGVTKVHPRQFRRLRDCPAKVRHSGQSIPDREKR